MSVPPYPKQQPGMSWDEYMEEIMKWADAVKAMGKNPRLYEPLSFGLGATPYIPKTPEEKAEHEEFLRQTEEFLKKLKAKATE